MKIFRKTNHYNVEAKRFCQLEIMLRSFLVLGFLVSCSSPEPVVTKLVEPKKEVSDYKAEAHVFPYSPRWFKIPDRFTLKDSKNQDYFHPFFDIAPFDEPDKKDLSAINFFMTTQEDSSFRYNLDMYSGSLYKDGDYCAGSDIWDNYKKEINRPNFIQGIVPRTYDQAQLPQRIITFSRFSSTTFPFSFNPNYYLKSRVVGSILLGQCQHYPCDSSSWKSTQVLVGVDPYDTYFSKVKTLIDLKAIVDWDYTRAILSNQEGVHQVGNNRFPAFRITKEMSLPITTKHFDANSKQIDVENLIKWRESCFKLYDDMWDKVGRIRRDTNEDQQELFLIYFKTFYKKSAKAFYECQKLVRPGTVNHDVNRMWFFTYIQAFSNLENNGLYYSCRDRAWGYNPKADEERYVNDQGKELEWCKAKEFEKMFDYSINGMGLMKNQLNKTFRFVEYDHQPGGSHQKIYSWVLFENKATYCKTKKVVARELQLDTFPQDVVWPSFQTQSSDTRLIK